MMKEQRFQSHTNLHRHRFVWDAHSCLPLTVGTDLSVLEKHINAGINFVSLNVGMDVNPWTEVIKTIAYFRRWISSFPKQYIIIRSVDDVLKAKQENKLAIAFDLEGTNPLNQDINMLTAYYELGVRQLLLAYNKNNLAGGGCLDNDIGLTKFGSQVIQEMNRLGMLIDCSHTGYQTTMDIMACSTTPVIFSHANPRSLWNHERNISDDQIKQCAKDGGVIGITGVGIFLGNNDARPKRMFEHIDYVTQLVGHEYVGIGLDYSFDQDEVKEFVQRHPDIFPPDKFPNSIAFMEPEQLPRLTEILLKNHYSEQAVRGILGENFLRVARQVWK